MFHSYLKVLPRYPFLLHLFIPSSLYISIPTYVLSCPCVSLSSYLCVATPCFSFLSPPIQQSSYFIFLYRHIFRYLSCSNRMSLHFYSLYTSLINVSLYLLLSSHLYLIAIFSFFLFILSSVLYASFITFLVTFITFV